MEQTAVTTLMTAPQLTHVRIQAFVTMRLTALHAHVCRGLQGQHVRLISMTAPPIHA